MFLMCLAPNQSLRKTSLKLGLVRKRNLMQMRTRLRKSTRNEKTACAVLLFAEHSLSEQQKESN